MDHIIIIIINIISSVHPHAPQASQDQSQYSKKAKLLSFIDSPSQTTQPDHDDAITMRQALIDYEFKIKLLDDNDPLV